MTAQEARKTAISHSGNHDFLPYEAVKERILKEAQKGGVFIEIWQRLEDAVVNRLLAEGYEIAPSSFAGEDGSILGAFLQISW